MLRYGMVGASVALVDIVLFYFFTEILEFNYLWVNGIGFVAGTLINYYLSIILVFTRGVRFSRPGEISVIFVVSIIGLFLNQLIIFLLLEQMGLSLMLAKLLTVFSVFFWNYLARKHFVFAPLKEGEEKL